MKNVTDEFTALARSAHGDLPLPGNNRWGKVLLLHTGAFPNEGPRNGITFIATDVQPIITPMVVSLRFSEDGQTFTPAVPGTFGGTVRVDLIEMIDVKTGAFKETFTLAATETQPFCGLICRALQLSVTLDGENVQLWVQAVAAPTTTLDCGDVVGPGQTNPGFSFASQARFPQDPPFIQPNPGVVISPANPNRQQFTIQNNAADELGISLQDPANMTPGAEFASVILPGGINAIYSSDIRFTGPISVSWRAASGGFLLFTQIVS